MRVQLRQKEEARRSSLKERERLRKLERKRIVKRAWADTHRHSGQSEKKQKGEDDARERTQREVAANVTPERRRRSLRRTRAPFVSDFPSLCSVVFCHRFFSLYVTFSPVSLVASSVYPTATA
ncbi:putative transmembrane protein [Toxoplasma gondii GT1]|uniref:Putative transmembrane protein n=1 Tax=Toxoplasma gondii (strain ATCC 50853 / GT1) TaxID=507601 RepID=S7VYW0_TOXGG|nr:putative transmembrane protein [Toxoplasma gondii GT1]